jgi:hypothetical protein
MVPLLDEERWYSLRDITTKRQTVRVAAPALLTAIDFANGGVKRSVELLDVL